MSGRARTVGLLAAALLGAGILAWLGPPREGPGPVRAAVTVGEALGGDPTGYARALAPRPFTFPADHGPHPAFRTEWWYFTGNLRGVGGRRFGFQLTLFRVALRPAAVPRRSAWGARQVYLGHLAVSDVQAGRFHAAERWRRDALGLAGAEAVPFRVWLDDWTVEAVGPGAFPVRLRAREGAVALDLTLEGGKPPVLHGEAGLSRKSAEPGNASYYYSLSRMPARGAIEVAGRRHQVEGLAWMDREWSTSALSAEQAGWDWFALQLDDGRELMLYRLRGRDGSIDPASAGTLVAPDGRARPLPAGQVTVEPRAWWRSPRSGARYPAGWRLAAPAVGLALDVRPLLPDQELNLTVRYWEGAVEVGGTSGSRPVTGHGYVELTGYAPEAVRQ